MMMMSALNCSVLLSCFQEEPPCNISLAGNLSEVEVRTGEATEMEDHCLSLDDYLEKYLGPRRSPVFLPVCVSYLLIFSVGAVGNALTCAVIARHRVMRTPTNFYLFSLAVSDLLVLLLGMPLELYELWSNYPFLLGASGCYFKTFLFETVCFASVLNVTALSVERYIAVVHPLRAKCVVTCAHAKRVILCVWLASTLCALPNTSLHGIFTLPVPSGHTRGLVPEPEPGSATCMLVKPRWIYNLIIQVSTLLFFVLPMATISGLYLLIGLRLRRERMLQVRAARHHEACSNVTSAGPQKTRHQQVTKMLCAYLRVISDSATRLIFLTLNTF